MGMGLEPRADETLMLAYAFYLIDMDPVHLGIGSHLSFLIQSGGNRGYWVSSWGEEFASGLLEK